MSIKTPDLPIIEVRITPGTRCAGGCGSRPAIRDISEGAEPVSIDIAATLALAVLLALVIVAGIWAGVTGGRF